MHVQMHNGNSYQFQLKHTKCLHENVKISQVACPSHLDKISGRLSHQTNRTILRNTKSTHARKANFNGWLLLDHKNSRRISL